MAKDLFPTVLDHIHKILAVSGSSADLTDRQLLARFVAYRDEAAFATLVRRHGALVYGVCRRLLHHAQDAEDVCQATFLVLARKADSMRWRESVGAWLYEVAYRLARKARVEIARRREMESRAAATHKLHAQSEASWREFCAVLDEELRRLSEAYRAPLILCYLEGQTRDQAARQLGWSLATLKRRLERGRKQLHVRLIRRGLTLSAALLTTGVAHQTASAGMTASWMSATVRAALPFALGQALPSGWISGNVAALAKGGLQMLAVTKSKMIVAFALTLSVLAAGAGLLTRQTVTAAPDEEKPQASITTADSPKRERKARVDQFGDPLPEGAIARLGAIRLRPGGRVNHLAFAPDGKRLASWAEDSPNFNHLSMWDTADGRELRRVDVPDLRVYAFTWLADGRGIAVVQTGDDSFHVWDFADPKADLPPLIRRPRIFTRVVGQDVENYGCFAIAPNGKLLAAGGSGSEDKERPVHVWNLATGRRVKDLGTPRLLGRQPSNCTALTFSSDSQTLFALSQARKTKEEKLVVWDVARGGQRQQMTVPPTTQQGYKKVCAAAPDGRTVALGLPDGTVRLWDVIKGQEQQSIAVYVPKPGTAPSGVSALAFSADGKHLLTGSRDNAVRVWELPDGREVRTMRGHHAWVEALALSTDGKRLASSGQDGVIHIWDTATGNNVCPLNSHRYWIWRTAVAPDGKTAATLGQDKTLRLWDLATGREKRQISFPARFAGPIVFTSDGKSLIACGGNRLRQWEAATGKIVQLPSSFTDQPCEVFRLAADGKTLLTTHEGKISIWEWPAGKLIRTFEIPSDKGKPGKRICDSFALSPDSWLIVTLTHQHWESMVGGFTQGNVGGGAVDLWEMATGRHVRQLFSSMGGFHEVAFTPDGTALVLAGSSSGIHDGPKALDTGLFQLNLVTGEVPRAYAAASNGQSANFRRVYTFAFSPDGRTLASAEDDGSAILFETATGLLRRRLPGHRGNVFSVAFAPNGKRLVTASLDNTGLVWDMALTALSDQRTTDRAKLWADLASSEPNAVNRALASLAAAPDIAVSLLKTSLRPAAAPDTATLDRLVADLDSEQFEAREKAFTELDRLGATAVAGLRKREAKTTSLEVRQRIARLLEKYDPLTLKSERVRELRALEILEHIGSPEARRILERLANGTPEAQLTQEAKASLARLER